MTLCLSELVRLQIRAKNLCYVPASVKAPHPLLHRIKNSHNFNAGNKSYPVLQNYRNFHFCSNLIRRLDCFPKPLDMYFMHVSGKGAIENRNKKQPNILESGMDGPCETFEVDNSHLSPTDERVGKTSLWLPVGARGDTRPSSPPRGEPRCPVAFRLTSRQSQSGAVSAFTCSSLFFFLMRKCCPALIRLQWRPPLFTSSH